MMKSGLRLLSCVFVFVAAGFFFVVLKYWHLQESISNYSASSDNQVPQQHAAETVPVGRIVQKYAVFSTTSASNEESRGFIFVLPLTALAWKRIGFNSVVIVVGSSDLWNSDPLLYTVLTSLRQLDASVIFLDAHPTNSVMVSQVRNNLFLPGFYRAA